MSKPTTRVLSFPELSTARFELRSWGEFSLFDRHLRQDSTPRGRKARAVIGYLAAQGGDAVSRERLAALLWSERGEHQARASLRQTLLELKPHSADAAGLVTIDRDHVRLNPHALNTDVGRLAALARNGELDTLSDALADVGDRLYAGLDGLDPAFDEWLALERRVQHDHLIALLAAAARRGLAESEYGSVSRLASEAQALEETNEAIAQIGMTADHACGDTSALRRRYHRLCEALKHELGITPSPETKALFSELTGPGAVSPGASTQSAAEPSPASQSPTAPTAPTRSWARGWRIAAVALIVVAAVTAGAVWFLRLPAGRAPAAIPRVAIAPFVALDGDPSSQAFARRLQDQVAGVLKDNLVGLSVVDPAAAGAKAADLKLSGTVSRDGGDWRVRTSLEDARKGVTLWAREFKRPPAQESTLQLETAVNTAEVIDDAIDARHEKAARRDPRALALALQSMDAIKSPALMNRGEPRRLLEEAVARAPDFVAARAHLALVLFFEGQTGAVGERTPLILRAHQEADASIRRDPSAAGSAYDTQYLMARVETPNDLVGAENILINGSAKAPRFPYLHMHRCRFLVEVGLARAALPYCQRALALRPLASPLGYRYAEALSALGMPELATRAIDKAISFHPEHMETRRVQFELAAFNGAPDAAAALLHPPADPDPCNCMPFKPEGVQAMDSYLTARRSGRPQDADKAVAALRSAVFHGQLHPRYLVFGAAALGRLDDAFAMLDQLAKRPEPLLVGDPGYLFEGPSAPLQRDPRFWPLAARAGYLRYWRARGVWPDFCRDPTLPYDCRTEAARVNGASPSKAAR
ncbi:BTAD domain-containing putative transcriptional regulator [Phenylobacterium sp. LjRoot219]|uniref:BTAD domain-containing putative transcriptional regulator n=1 Tax=Phenylobacterium sp. LjRoot219 TaxID=3342283 RepID=UPI003ECD5FC7